MSYDEVTRKAMLTGVIHGCSQYALTSERTRDVAAELAAADRRDRGVR